MTERGNPKGRLPAWRLWALDCAYIGLLLVLLPWLVVRSLRTGRYRKGIRQRLLGLDELRPEELDAEKPTIWLHGVSVGEIQLLIPLVKRLQRDFPSHQIALSATTDSGYTLAQQQLPGIPLFYFPVDFSWAIKRTLATLKPALLVLGELEIWPNLIRIAADQAVPILVVNGRMSDRSHRGYRRFGRFTQPMFRRLQHVACQSDVDARRFVDCGCAADRVSVSGNLKFDNVVFNPQDDQVEARRSLMGLGAHHRVLVVGSTQEPEELAAMTAFQEIRSSVPHVKLIVIPRHPDRFVDVYNQLAARGPVLRRSLIATPVKADEWDVLLVDTIGELRWWWGIAEVAVVGGSFGDRGGQNMVEPAAYGVNVAVGPNTSNFRAAMEQLGTADAITQLNSLDELTEWLLGELRNPAPGRERGARAKRVIERQQGATDRTCQSMAQLLQEEPRSRLDAA